MDATNASVSPSALELALKRAASAPTKAPPGYESNEGGEPGDIQLWLKRLNSACTAGKANWSVDDRDISLLQAFLAREGGNHGGNVKAIADGYEAKFDNLDPGWIWSLRDWVKKLRKHDFVVAAGDPVPIKNDATIAVLGDWGTGLYGAPQCATAIDGLAKVDLIVHLGDIYYAGDRDEIQSRFLAYWPRRTDALHRALNGNHEMYTGGKGYFELILADPRFKQQASHFALINDAWLMVGLDTAYEDHDLYGEQATWLQNLAERYPDQRVMLFSHHQPFSAFEGDGLKLVHKLFTLLSSGRIAAWYWGHEHACVRYDEHPSWKLLGRCVGHGGFPYFRFLDRPDQKTLRWVDVPGKRSVPPCHVLDGPNPFVREAPDDYGPNGFLTLELSGRKVVETYRDPTGTVVGTYEFVP